MKTLREAIGLIPISLQHLVFDSCFHGTLIFGVVWREHCLKQKPTDRKFENNQRPILKIESLSLNALLLPLWALLPLCLLGSLHIF